MSHDTDSPASHEVASAITRGAGERDEGEIVITSEMTEAGYRVLAAAGITDDLLEADRLTVCEIYRAMARLAGQSALPG